jgi:ABC-type lipoprotein release transport system permease subunit
MSRIDKHRNILDFALSSLFRRKRKNIALVIMYTTLIFILASVIFFTEAIKREACILLQNSPEMIVQKTMAGRHDLIPDNYIRSIESIRGVQGVRGRLWGYYYDPARGANYTLTVPEHFSFGTGYIAIGKGVSRTLEAGRGDLVPFRAYNGSYVSLEVADIMTAESEIISSDLVLLSEPDFREISGAPEGFFTDLSVRVRNAKELPVIADKIRRVLPDTRPILKDEIVRTYETIFDWRGGIVMVILLGAVFAFVILAWDKATGLSSEEKREIGILKGIGWETSDVLWLKFWEGAVVSLTSFFLGVILSYVHVFLASFMLFEPVLKGWSVLYPDFRLVPFIDPFQIMTLFFLTVLPYTAATIVPSWRAATIDPDTVMRL